MTISLSLQTAAVVSALCFHPLLVTAWISSPDTTCFSSSTFAQQRTTSVVCLSESRPSATTSSLDNDDGSLLYQNKEEAPEQLFASFAALSLGDQYDAVLTGLCAKILDDTTAVTAADIQTSLQDPMQLVKEMNSKRIAASPRSLMALIDSTVKSQDAATMARIMSLCRQNAAATLNYGAMQGDVLTLPSNPRQRIRCPDGSFKTRAERLASVPPVPHDERAKEVGAALSTLAVAVACEATNILPGDINDVAPLANIILTAMVTVVVVDNCYDLIQTAGTLAVRQVGKNNNINKDKDNKQFSMPPKESLPLGLGTGKLTGTIVRGTTRLMTVDASREALCEAAALFAAYTLGLPCFAFRSNALEASVLAVESAEQDDMVSLLSDSGLLRLLVWLYAPVAMERQRYPVCIMSDPSQADGFLQRLEGLAATRPAVAEQLWWLDVKDGAVVDTSERADLLLWAYTEADLLLRTHKKTVEDLSRRLEGGAATVGDCVAVLEGW